MPASVTMVSLKSVLQSRAARRCLQWERLLLVNGQYDCVEMITMLAASPETMLFARCSLKDSA
jgi:hypothetical protein